MSNNKRSFEQNETKLNDDEPDGSERAHEIKKYELLLKLINETIDKNKNIE